MKPWRFTGLMGKLNPIIVKLGRLLSRQHLILAENLIPVPMGSCSSVAAATGAFSLPTQVNVGLWCIDPEICEAIQTRMIHAWPKMKRRQHALVFHRLGETSTWTEIGTSPGSSAGSSPQESSRTQKLDILLVVHLSNVKEWTTDERKIRLPEAVQFAQQSMIPCYVIVPVGTFGHGTVELRNLLSGQADADELTKLCDNGMSCILHDGNDEEHKGSGSSILIVLGWIVANIK